MFILGCLNTGIQDAGQTCYAVTLLPVTTRNFSNVSKMTPEGLNCSRMPNIKIEKIRNGSAPPFLFSRHVTLSKDLTSPNF